MQDRFKLFTTTLIVLLCFMSPAYAAEKIISPDFIPGSIKVDAEGVIQKAEEISGLIIIDSRIESDRQHGHIEDSISLPDEQTNCKTLSKVVPATGSPILFYCNGPKCGRSALAVKIALKCGYNNIYWFRGGFEEWKEKNLPFIKQ